MAMKFTGPRISWGMFWFIFLWRWFTGNTLDGDPRTDAGWIRTGIRSVDSRYPHPTRWQLMARWKRMTIRLTAILLPVTAGVAWLVWPTVFYRVSVALILVLATLLARPMMRRYERYNLNHHIIGPFTQTASHLVSHAPAAMMRDMHVDMTRTKDEGLTLTKVQIPVPPEYNPGEAGKKELVKLAGERFGGEWGANLNVKRWPFYIALSRLPEPREKFSYADLLPLVAQQKPGVVILGIGSNDKIVVADIIRMYPHVALSIGTGGGKSSFYRNMIAQLSYHGDDEFDVCDVKMISLAGLERVPGMRIHRGVEQIWKVVAEFRREMEARYQEMLTWPDPDFKTFKAKYLFLEEMNAFTMLSQITWSEVKDKGAPKQEPVWNDIRLVAVMARQVNMHIIGAWQLLLAAAAGGDSQLRTQFGLKILSRFDPQAWDLLVGTRPREHTSSVPGRAVAVMEGERKRFQMPNVSVNDAMDMVMKGKSWKSHNGLLVPAPIRKPSPRRRKAA
jgi:hypothetical protein